MIEKNTNYPAYTPQNETILSQKVTVFMSYEQLIEIASIFFYLNRVLARIPKWLGGIRLNEYTRALHKSIHDSCVNCCLSLEEKERFEREGGGKHD